MIVFILGTMIMLSSLIFINKSWKIIFTVLIIGVIIVALGAMILMSTSQCQTECRKEGAVFSHQEVNCEGELTCYCKTPVTQPKPKVVIIT